MLKKALKIELSKMRSKPRENRFSPFLRSKSNRDTKRGVSFKKSAYSTDIYQGFFNENQHSIQKRRKYENRTEKVAEDHRNILQRSKRSNNNMQKIELLAKLLSEQKGKTSYGYLPKSIKKLVDEILHDLAENEGIKGLYDEWCELDNMKSQVYTDKPKKKKPIEENESFKSIKNDIINEAKKLNNNPTPKSSPNYNTNMMRMYSSLLCAISNIITDKVRDWYSAKHKTVDKKLLEEMSELDRRVVIDNPTDDEDEGQGHGLIL